MTQPTEAQKIQTLRAIRGPLIVWMIMIGFVAVYVSTSAIALIRTHISNKQFQLLSRYAPSHQSLIPFFILLATVCLIATIWFGPKLYQHRRYLLIGCPMLLLLIYIRFMPTSAPVLMIGTYPVFTIESIVAYNNSKRILRYVTTVYLFMWGAYSLAVGWMMALVTLESFGFVMMMVFYYWRFYQRQVQERERVENLYTELQLAYTQVETSTIRAERQRVARELHDTLTQGLAGTVMQLEAAKSFLAQGNTERTAEIIDNSIDIARDALHESRITLTDLRSTTEESLPARLHLVTEAIRKNYQVTTTTKINDIPDYSPSQLTEITRIVTEALTNVAKHANTDQALLTSSLHDDIFKLKIIDFGAGFDMSSQSKKKLAGHFGLQGLQERATRLDGVITVVSAPDEGTTVTLTMPATRKELANS